jgi:hypothetical protein
MTIEQTIKQVEVMEAKCQHIRKAVATLKCVDKMVELFGRGRVPLTPREFDTLCGALNNIGLSSVPFDESMALCHRAFACLRSALESELDSIKLEA